MTELLAMSEEQLAKAARELDDSVSIHYVYLEGFPFTTFALLDAAREILDLPPPFRGQPIRWERFWDVRVFTERAEWHAWSNDGLRWLARRRRLADVDNANRRRFALVGNRRGRSQDGWVHYSEASGAELWLPTQVAEQRSDIALCVCDVIESHESTGLAGVVDAFFCGFEPLSAGTEGAAHE